MSEGATALAPAAETFEKMTMLELAEFGLSEIVFPCVLESGEFAGQTVLLLDARQAAGCEQLFKTLAILAQHDAVIKQAIKQASFRKSK